MAIEQEQKNTNPLHKEFQSLLDQDFKDRKLKENEIIKATVTEITKNFIVVDCKAKMEGMIPIEEFKNDDELTNLKIGSQIDVYLERIESFKGEIVISRDKARKMKAWKKMEKTFETQEEMTGYITGKVKGGFIATVEGLPCFMPSSQIDVRPIKKIDHLMNTPIKVIATRLDKQRGNVCVSRRAVLEKSKSAEITEALKNIKEGDFIITKDQLISQIGTQEIPEALIIRTLPNIVNKLYKNWSESNWAYLEEAAAIYIADLGVQHLLIDLPSVDREFDGGQLLAHKAFWKHPRNTRKEATITEMVYLPDSIKDGEYFLNLQIASFENDASPSKPVLFEYL